MGLMRGMREIGPDDIDITDLPEEVPLWVQEAAGVPVRRNKESGELEFFILGNYHPTADIDDILSLRSIVKMGVTDLSPFVRLPIEWGTGRSLFSGQKLRGEQSEFLGKIMNAEHANFLRNIRLLSELDKMDPFGHYHKSRRGLPEHLKLLRAIGPSVYPISLERERISFDKERLERLKKAVARARKAQERMLTKEED
jgi:hypothetical protein